MQCVGSFVLDELTRSVTGLDASAMRDAQTHLDRLTKPPGSLGRLEALAVRLAGITGQVTPPVRPATVVVMAGDHGVTAEGVSAYPAEVTAQMVRNFVRGGAAVNALADLARLSVRVVDVGVRAQFEFHPAEFRPGLRFDSFKVRPGTDNMVEAPAMSRQDALAAMEVGATIVQSEVASGTRVLCLGEMGIGNTTSASALLAVFGGVDPERAVGPGTGLDEAGVRRKAEVVRRAIDLHRPDPGDAVGALAAVGGLEVAALAGVILAAAALRLPVLLDGFITGAAALAAMRVQPRVVDYLIASHRSAESAHGVMLELLGLKPLFDLEFRLGEGTGAILAHGLLEAAVRIASGMATFSEAGVSGSVASPTG